MRCKYCNEKMEDLDCHDDPKTGYAHNIYHCAYCGTILQNRVWKMTGNLWIKANGECFDELIYKDYHGTIQFSQEDLVFHGKLLNTTGLFTYEADTRIQLEQEFKKLVDELKAGE